MEKQKLAMLVAALALGGAALAPARAAEGPVKIGVPAPLTGSYASAGTDIANAAMIAAEDINKKSGVLGRKIAIDTADDQCDAQIGVQAAEKLVQSGDQAIAGGYCSSAAIPESSVFHDHGLPFVADASTNPRLTEQGFADVFRVIGRDDEQGPFAANFMKNELHAKRVAIIHDNTVYARWLAEQTRAALKKLGGVDIVYFDAITPGQSDYTSVLSVVKSDNPDVIYYTGYYSEAALIVKEARALGVKATLMAGDANNDPTLLKVAGPAANGLIITTAPLAQFLGGSEVQNFIKEYQSRFGHEPGPYSVYEYDAIGVTAAAMDRAKSTDPQKVAAALHQTKDYHGITGTISFNQQGDRENAVYITLIVKNDQFTAYKALENGHWVDVKAASKAKAG